MGIFISAEMLGETVRGKDPLASRAPYLSRSHDIHGKAEVMREMRRGNKKGTSGRHGCNKKKCCRSRKVGGMPMSEFD
jgi:hypothetical protein